LEHADEAATLQTKKRVIAAQDRQKDFAYALRCLPETGSTQFKRFKQIQGESV